MMIANEIIEIYAIDGDSSILLGVVTDISNTIKCDYVGLTDEEIVYVRRIQVSYVQPSNNIEGKITASASSFEKAFRLKKENGEDYGIFN